MICSRAFLGKPSAAGQVHMAPSSHSSNTVTILSGYHRLAEDGGQRNTTTLIWNTYDDEHEFSSTTLMTLPPPNKPAGGGVSPPARNGEALKLWHMVIGIPMMIFR